MCVDTQPQLYSENECDLGLIRGHTPENYSTINSNPEDERSK